MNANLMELEGKTVLVAGLPPEPARRLLQHWQDLTPW
jgi:hypothetical protein